LFDETFCALSQLETIEESIGCGAPAMLVSVPPVRGRYVNGRHRVITLPAYAVEDLRRLKRQQAEELLALGVRQTGDTLLCARADGEPHQPLSLTYEFARFMGRMKDIPRVRFHDLRHSHATQLLASGVHPKIASERLGHASVGITLDLYSHVTDTMQSDAAVKLDSAMQVAKSHLAGPK
jgi:integrase